MERKITGHLTIEKVYNDGEVEIVFAEDNVIVSGMGVALGHLFAGSGSDNILDYRLDRFQLGVSGDSSLQVASTYQLSGALSSVDEYTGGSSNIVTSENNVVENGSTSVDTSAFALIPQNKIAKVGTTAVRYILVVDSESCNGIQRGGSDKALSEIGLFMKNYAGAAQDEPILVAYRSFTDIIKTSDFSLIFYWTLYF